MAMNNPPDLILMDISMPGLDGLQATMEIATVGDCHIPVIALTASVMEGTRKDR
jgi:CheY-like chemotaxis protein